MGVGVSARDNLPNLGLFAQVYYSAGLFVLGGMDLGTPIGGPRLARSLLWVAFFLAPVITTSTVVEGLRRVGYGAVELFGMRQHVIVAGLGNLGMSFVAAARRRDPRCLIVAIDRDVNRAAVTQARRHARVHFLPGDIQLPGAFSHLALERTRAVALLTDNDLLNLKIAFQLAQRHPRLRIVAHCSDLALERSLADAWGETGRGRIHVFNSHRAAAQHLYERHLHAHFAETPAKDTVVLAGFGRFAQTILEFLGQESSAEIERILIAAPAATLGLRKFHSQVHAFAALETKPLDGDLTDPDTWQAIERELGVSTAPQEPPTVLLASEDESVNWQSALLARRRWPQSRIFVRCQDESSFAEEVARQHRFTVLPVDALLREALYTAHATWLGAAQPQGAAPMSSRGGSYQSARAAGG
jgi:voltage-gated potassium channel Kch